MFDLGFYCQGVSVQDETQRVTGRTAAPAEGGERTEAENTLLRTTVSALRREENKRIGQLCHDLKSPLGVIRGYSTLLREFIEKHPDDLRAFPQRTLNGIDEASQKMLEIIDTAEEWKPGLTGCEIAAAERDNK